MKQRQALRFRIIVFFCAYLGILLVIYSAAISGLISLSQDNAFEKQLIATSDQIIASLRQTGKPPQNLPLHFQLYTEQSAVPPELAAKISGQEPGFFEINTKKFDYHAGIFTNPATGREAYLFYDVGSYEFSDAFETRFNIALLGLGICILLIGWLLSRSVADQIMNPITALIQKINSFSPDAPFQPISDYQADDEIGTLVRTINDLIERVDRFVQREREFTLFASHELRTPISVIKGAAEIMQTGMASENRKLSAPLERIEISVKELETLINTFLMLARRKSIGHPDDPPCEIGVEVEKAAAAYRYLLQGKPVEIIINTKEAGSVPAPASVVNMAIGNLVRNAFQYTMSGRVEIIGKEQHIIVRDTGLGLEDSKPSAGTGLGLLIVKRLCERMGWRSEISKLPDGGTRADLFFS